MSLIGSKEYTVVMASAQPRQNFFIPRLFSEAITLHIVKNNLSILNASLLLIVQGPKGEGKSTQTLEICSRMGINAVVIPGSSLGGEFEKEPVNILRDAYLYASKLRDLYEQDTVLIIEDLDTSIASFRPDTKFTVNSQLLSGALMYICQDPTRVGGTSCHRIPIIATGNDFTNFYEPLIRHGRATFFDWVPDLDTKKEIVKSIFEGLLHEKDLEKISEVVEYFSSSEESESVAFYQQIRNDIFDSLILETILEMKAVNYSIIHRRVTEYQKSLTIDDLKRIGEKRKLSRPKKFIGDFGGNQ